MVVHAFHFTKGRIPKIEGSQSRPDSAKTRDPVSTVTREKGLVECLTIKCKPFR
jgi:hypothetical protein